MSYSEAYAVPACDTDGTPNPHVGRVYLAVLVEDSIQFGGTKIGDYFSGFISPDAADDLGRRLIVAAEAARDEQMPEYVKKSAQDNPALVRALWGGAEMD